MLKFEKITAVAVPMPQPNIDTDQIIPARFLCKPREDGLAPFLFHDQRMAGDPAASGTHVMDQLPYQQAGILVAGPNFGCGSSREHAVCALLHSGIRVIIAAGISDIFIGNALENGLLPVVLSNPDATCILRQLTMAPGARLSVDLKTQTVTTPAGELMHFDIDQRRKRCLLLGLDSIELTLRMPEAIAEFERHHETWR